MPVRNACQAQPKMSRVKVFYIIISIGALFSKVSSTEDKKRHCQDDWDDGKNEDGEDDDSVGHVLVGCTLLPSLPRP